MPAALITGAADGIGAGLAAELARRGSAVTLLDVDLPGAERVAAEIRAGGGQAQAVRCDVADEAAQSAAFELHMRAFGRLDYAVLNAGVMESGDLIAGKADAGEGWRRALDVNLTAVMVGVRLAVRHMAGVGTKGTIMVTASAGGIFPMAVAPVYSASKAACIMLTRSLAAPLMRRHGIRICALCPQFTDTALVRGVARVGGDALAEELTREVGGMGRLLRVEQVVAAGAALLGDASKVGTCLVVLAPDGELVEPTRPRFQRVQFAAGGGGGGATPALRAWAAAAVPASARKVVVQRLSTDFREATAIVWAAVPNPPPPGTVLVRNCYVGINASDINFTSGRYQGSQQAAQRALPFEAGFETVGVVAAAGEGVGPAFAPGAPVAAMVYGGFSEYQVVPAKLLFAVPRPTPQVLALLTSGLTASIALEQAGRMGTGETVLVTAAAGGTGQFAVQLAKAAGNVVVATCGGGAKAATLKTLGADRVIDHTREDVKAVLRREFPGGVDLVYESVGGCMFKTCVGALAPRGRLVVIGAVSQYAAGWAPSAHVGLPELLLARSATCAGFFLPAYAAHFKRHLARLVAALEAGRLRAVVDAERFVGLEAVAAAVDRLQSGRSAGKVCVQIPADVPPPVPPAARL